DEKVTFTLIGGNQGVMTRGEILLHVVNHTSYHRGFVADLFYQVPARPPTTDLPVFLREEHSSPKEDGRRRKYTSCTPVAVLTFFLLHPSALILACMRITLVENFRAVFYAPFYAPIALGAYESEGLQVSLKMSADAAHTAASLIAGDGDVSWGGPLRLMIALETNPQAAALAFCEAVGRDPFFLLGRAPRPGFRLEDLLG